MAVTKNFAILAPVPLEHLQSGKERKPTRFVGTVVIAPRRRGHEFRQRVQESVEQLETQSGSDVIDAEVPSDLDRHAVGACGNAGIRRQEGGVSR